MEEDGFVRAILAGPQDNNLRLVYADWLEEQNDPTATAKAAFLRTLVSPATTEAAEKSRREQLQQMAAALDTDWLAVVSQLDIELCQQQVAAAVAGRFAELRAGFTCDRRWEDLRATGDRAVRFCDGCQHDVHYCDTIRAARVHANEGHCIAVDLGIVRRNGDLEPEPGLWVGRPSPEALRPELERMKQDPVSEKRSRRKKENASES